MRSETPEHIGDIIARAVMKAYEDDHKVLTEEHIFLALLENMEAWSIIEQIGARAAVDISEDIQDKLFSLLDSTISKLKEDEIVFSKEALDLQDRAQKLVAQRQKKDESDANKNENKIYGADVLIALMENQNSYVSYCLREHGLSLSKAKEIYNDQGYNTYKGSDVMSADLSTTEEFCTDLVAKAKDGKIDPVIGREKEINHVIQTLLRRKKANPVLVGEPGVGKTAIAEGLALRIAEGKIPKELKGKTILSLSMASLTAGTTCRGEFEERLQGIVDELSGNENVILFIDEVHTMVGAGASSGKSLDAANIMKPALANGEIRAIGATTLDEYRQHIEKDSALERRFNRVMVVEPSVDETYTILKGLKSRYESYHNVKFTKTALKEAAKLAQQYMTDRQLPDSAIDLIDEAAASLKMSMEYRADGKRAVGIKDVRVAAAKMSGRDLSDLTLSDKDKLMTLADNLKQTIFGQDEAIDEVADAMILSKAGLSNDNKPVASLLFNGEEGTGKTELAKQIAVETDSAFLKLDMSEFMEKHNSSRLTGATAGYVGYEDGSQLIEFVRNNPRCVVLLDEFEKAHTDIHNILLQVMDNAELTDSKGRKADFRQAVLVMASNIRPQEVIKSKTVGFVQETTETKTGDKVPQSAVISPVFSPEFRDRLSAVIQFNKATEQVTMQIADKFLDDLQNKLRNKKVTLNMTEEAKRHLIGVDNIAASLSGARKIEQRINKEIARPLSKEILAGKLCKGGIVKVSLDSSVNKLSFQYPKVKAKQKTARKKRALKTAKAPI